MAQFSIPPGALQGRPSPVYIPTNTYTGFTSIPPIGGSIPVASVGRFDNGTSPALPTPVPTLTPLYFSANSSPASRFGQVQGQPGQVQVQVLEPTSQPEQVPGQVLEPISQPGQVQEETNTNKEMFLFQNNYTSLLLWFVIITIIVWLFLYFLKPVWVQETDLPGNPTGIVSIWKSFLWAVIIALILTLIIWVIRRAIYPV